MRRTKLTRPVASHIPAPQSAFYGKAPPPVFLAQNELALSLPWRRLACPEHFVDQDDFLVIGLTFEGFQENQNRCVAPKIQLRDLIFP